MTDEEAVSIVEELDRLARSRRGDSDLDDWFDRARTSCPPRTREWRSLLQIAFSYSRNQQHISIYMGNDNKKTINVGRDATGNLSIDSALENVTASSSNVTPELIGAITAARICTEQLPLPEGDRQYLQRQLDELRAEIVAEARPSRISSIWGVIWNEVKNLAEASGKLADAAKPYTDLAVQLAPFLIAKATS